MTAMQLLYVLKCGKGKRKKIDGVRVVRLFNIKLRYTTTLVQTFAFSQPVVVLRALFDGPIYLLPGIGNMV